MENNFIQMAYTNGPIFKHIIDYGHLYFTNGLTNFVRLNVNCLWLVGVILIFNCIPQIIVQRCQIVALRRPNDISSAVDMRSSKTGRKTSSVETKCCQYLALQFL